jgi:tetratricopeptide (TPR) repeat protein
LRFSGDLEGALQTIREARSEVERTGPPSDPGGRANLHGVLFREGVILGQDGNISLERPHEAVAVLRSAFDLAEKWSQTDPHDSSIRLRSGESARELGRILVNTDAQRALAVYQKALLLLGEVKNNTVARREEATLQASASYALRRLNRGTEAQQRIDSAFRLLRETKDYPSTRMSPGDEADTVLRAQGDQLAATGQPRRAVEVYQELLDKIMAFQPDPKNDLSQATQLSRIYEALRGLYRRTGDTVREESVEALRLELWRYWDRKLPDNRFVLRQLGVRRTL